MISDSINDRIGLIFEWYKGMVSEKTGRLLYLYDPETNSAVIDGSPIRDIASIWDMEIVSHFLNRRDLEPVIKRSLEHFSYYLKERDGYLVLDPEFLGEPSGIAHSAFMLLSLIHSRMPSRKEKARLLADGIAAQQRQDGSYKIFFGPEPDEGQAFYPGEAMLALLEYYEMTNDMKYLQSAKRGFVYYRDHFYRANKVGRDLRVFFANWQSQYCHLLYRNTRNEEVKRSVKDYVFELHDRIIARDFYENVRKFPEQQSSVEVACALEGLNDAFAMAVQEKDYRRQAYQRAMCISLDYLLSVQCVRVCTEKEKGGFGFSLSDRTQRIDVTGHFANGMIKSLSNGVAC